MSKNPPPLGPVLQADLAIREAEEAMAFLERRKRWWDGINGAFLSGREKLENEQKRIENLVSTSRGDRGLDFAKRLLSWGKYQGPVLDSLARDLQNVQSTLRGGGLVATVRNAVLTPTERKAQSLGLPTDPVALHQKKVELAGALSLTNFSANMALDPLTRGSRRMDKYLAALESGNYTKALKLANAEPPLSVRWQFWAPWKAQAMRDDRAALVAGVESYRRTKEAVKAADSLLNTIEKDTAKALLKVAHSDEWQRLRAHPGIEAELAGNPAFAILMKYRPEQGTSGRILRMQKGNPSLSDLRADLAAARMDGVANGTPVPTGKDMAAALDSLVKRVETARQEQKELHTRIGDQIRNYYNRALKHNARLERDELTARVGENGKRAGLREHFQSVLEPVRAATEDLREAPGKVFHATQDRLSAARAVRQAHKDGDPEALAAASVRQEKARGQYETARDEFVVARDRLGTLLGSDAPLAEAFGYMSKAPPLPAETRGKIVAAAGTAREGGFLPKDTPGTSFLRSAFTSAAQETGDKADKVVVALRRTFSFFVNLAERTAPVHRERIEPVLA